MEDIKKLKKDTKLVLQNTILPSPKKVNGSSSDSIDYGKQKNESSSKSLINIQKVQQPIQIKEAQSQKEKKKEIEEGIQLNLEFEYEDMLRILEDPRLTEGKKKFDFMIMVANKLEISIFDLIYLLPSKTLLVLFRDYKKEEGVLVSLVLPQAKFFNQPKSTFQDIDNRDTFSQDFFQEHIDDYSSSKIPLKTLDEGKNLQDEMRSFFGSHVIPQILDKLLGFSKDNKSPIEPTVLKNRMEEVIGKLEEQIYSQSGKIKSNPERHSSQESQNSANVHSQSSEISMSEKKGIIHNMKQLSISLSCFMEKIHRKGTPQNIQLVLQSLERISSLNSDFQIDPAFQNFADLKKDKRVLFRLAMSGSKKLIFLYLQDKMALHKYSTQCILNFKKKETFLSYYKLFSSGESSEDTVFKISGNFENFCKELESSISLSCTFRHAITLIRFLTPYLESFTPQFNQPSTYIYLVRSLCWRVVRFILFIHNGDLSYFALEFLHIYHAQLFSERKTLYSDRDRFIQLLLAFMYVFRSRTDAFFEVSKKRATELIQMLLQTVGNYQNVRKSMEYMDERNADISSSSQCSIKGFWQLNYNFAQLDSILGNLLGNLLRQPTIQRLSQMEQELRRIQEQPLIDEQLLLILAHLKNLLLYEQQEQIQLFFDDKNLKNLNEQEIRMMKQQQLLDYQHTNRRNKGKIFIHLLSLTRLADNKKILTKSPLPMAQLVKIKQELLVDCLGLIGPFPQQDEFPEMNSNGSRMQWQNEVFSLDLQVSSLKQKIQGFLNVNVFNTDIPVSTLCVCKEYVDSKFPNKKKKLYDRLECKQNSNNNSIDEQQSMEIEYQVDLNDTLISNVQENSNAFENSFQFKNNDPLQFTKKQSFSLMKWLAELIMKMKKQDDVIKIIEGCTELMSNSDLGENMAPLIIYKYLNQVENSHVPIISVINKILEDGHHSHKLIITKSLIVLDTYFRRQLKEEKQQNYDPFKPQSIMHLDSPHNIFLRNFAFIKIGISTDKYCRTLVEMSEHKRAIQVLEIEIEQRQIQRLNQLSKEEESQRVQDITQLIFQLYNIYKEVNEDYKNIDPFEMLKKLQLDESEIKKYQEQNMKWKSDGLCAEIYSDKVDTPFKDETSQLKLINLLSKSIPDFSQINLDYAFSKYLRAISWGFQKIISFENINSYDNMYNKLISAIQKLKYAFSLQLVNARSSYDSKFSTLVKIQVLVNVENMLTILKFLKHHNKESKDPKLAEKLLFTSSTVSLDCSQPDFLLKLNPQTQLQKEKGLSFLEIIQTPIKKCLIKIVKSHSNLQLSYDQESTLRIVYKYLICIIFNQCPQIRPIYIISLQKFAQFCYKTEKYQEALTALKRAKHIWKEDKAISKGQDLYMLQAKIEKKLGHIKKAIHKLSKVESMESRIKRVTYKYQHNFKLFLEKQIENEFMSLMKKVNDSEKLRFKYAKFIDSNYLISDDPDQKEIFHKINAIESYLISAKYGHQYIHQSLPRAIRLLVELYQDIELLSMKESQEVVKLLRDRQKKIFDLANDIARKIEPFKLAGVVNQLTSHITTSTGVCSELFIFMLARVGAKFPEQSIWWLLPIKYMNKFNTEPNKVISDSNIEERWNKIQAEIERIDIQSANKIKDVFPFYSNLLNFALKLIENQSSVKLEQYLQQPLKKLNLIVPKKEFIFPRMPHKNEEVHYDYNPYHPHPVYMEKLKETAEIMSSKQRPKLITVFCSDKVERRFLLKSQTQDENSHEQRTSELISFLNLLLRKENLSYYELPSYSIIRLNSKNCLVEWVDQTFTLKKILEGLWNEKKQKSKFNNLKLDGDKLHPDEWAKQKKMPSVLQDFFNTKFTDSQEWYNAKDSYIKTYASWCVLGYILGLGDRHTDNILIKVNSGEIVHIDYAVIFGSGKALNIPETIPFRLTKNIEFALGAFKSQGLFRKAMIDICLCFSKHIDDIMGFWDCFANDLYGGRKSSFNHLCNQIKSRIKLTNFKSTEEGIDSLIEISKDDYCLRDMFKGWWPHA